MGLRTQARIMGFFASQCMMDHDNIDITMGINMELFTHVTSFCGMKVVLLGLYNGQTTELYDEDQFTSYTRSTNFSEDGGEEEPSFVRILLLGGRVIGAVMIGETDIEETIENLILDQLDVSNLGASILDPDFDLSDYFD